MQVVVLGTHRSGTSALTGILGLLGCHLGDAEDFLPVRPDNPLGDRERRDVWRLDEDAFRALDVDWRTSATDDLERLDPGTRNELEARIREIVAALDRQRPWAIKDPRLCTLFPLWRPALTDAVCVHAHRRPVQVAASLRSRDGFPLQVGLAIWEMQVRSALRNAVGLPQVVVDHATLMREPAAAARRLRQQLESLGVTGLHDPDPAALAASIDPRLQHQKGGDDEETPLLTADQRTLAESVASGSALETTPDPPRPEVIEFLRGFFAESTALQRRGEELDGELARQHAIVQELEQRHASVVQGLEQRLEQRLDAAGQEHEAFRRSLLEALDQTAKLRSLLDLVLRSRRWQFADRLGETLGLITGKPRQAPASELQDRWSAEFDEWRRQTLDRHRLHDDR